MPKPERCIPSGLVVQLGDLRQGKKKVGHWGGGGGVPYIATPPPPPPPSDLPFSCVLLEKISHTHTHKHTHKGTHIRNVHLFSLSYSDET